MIMPGRNFNADQYRFGFNGMEADDELKGTKNSYDFGARIYDPRLGRWLAVDTLAGKFPGYSPYNFSVNTDMDAGDTAQVNIVVSNGTKVVDINGSTTLSDTQSSFSGHLVC